MKSFAIFSTFALFVLTGAIENRNRSLATCPTSGIFDASNTFCCPESCGTCGGGGCHLRDGGAQNCCTSQITESCADSDLPCIATEDEDPVDECPEGSIPDSSGMKCCDEACGTCGGYGCNLRPGGSAACCTSQVTISCDEDVLPCKINGDPPTTSGPTGLCPDGSIPDSSGLKCCSSSCGTCGGFGCNLRPGGAAACCTGSVTISCSEDILPCVAEIITEPPTATEPPTSTEPPTTADPCPEGSIPDGSGLKCCDETCGTCGGFGCNLRPGGASACCTSSVSISCSTGVLPCLLDEIPIPTCPEGSITDESGNACCPSSCGACGGFGCHAFPGGASSCCTGSITASCSDGVVPCNLYD